MLPDSVQHAMAQLAEAFAREPRLQQPVHARWQTGGLFPSPLLTEELRAAADHLDRKLPALSRTSGGVAHLSALFGDERGEVLFLWCAANAGRPEAKLARLLTAASAHEALREHVIDAARDRVVQGPLQDALACVPLLGTGDALALPDNAMVKARLEILLWEAGASGLQLPELAAWLWASERTFQALVGEPARGALRGRVLAARCLDVCVRHLPPDTSPELVGRTLQVLQPLLLHPEPLVWIHAARALGGLAGAMEQLEGMLLDWTRRESPILRQRAMTAFASLPGKRLGLLGHELTQLLEAPEEEHWVLSAAAAATPYLFTERRELWDRLVERISSGAGGAASARALSRGLATLWRGGQRGGPVENPSRVLRDMARRARTEDVEDWRRWLEIIAISDPIDDAERDPLDLERGLENLIRLAAQYDDEEADARAARFAEALAPTFLEAKRVVLGAGSVRHRAAAMNALEGCARSLALRLWGPQLATRPAGDPIEEPDLEETWRLVARTPSELLDEVAARRNAGSKEPLVELMLEVLALRLGGYALDACGEDADLGPGRGPTAHDTCRWLRKIDGLVSGARELPPPLRSAVSALFWRLVDTTRGTALGEVDDVEWLGPFAAWWALVIDRPAVLKQLAEALPMLSEEALDQCCELAEVLRASVAAAPEDGAWGADAQATLSALNAAETELSGALLGLAASVEHFAVAAGPRGELDALCLELVLAAERLQASLADPVKALHRAVGSPEEDSLSRAQTENAPRVAALVARSIRAREPALLDVWFSSLGPVTSAIVEAAVGAAVRRTPPPRPAPKAPERKSIEGYELLRPLGEGGIGAVWLVRKPGADRMFVLKIPKAEALANASETEREGILASFIEEAKALAGLYHPNVANIIDRGVSEGMPYLVLEYLIGADLKEYSAAKRMTLFELRQVVMESCAGLAALHGAGLVHRDIKPANLWLRLPLAGGVRFDPSQHRDPARTPPLATVVIDFGMVRATRIAAEAGGRFVAGTPGYLAPEQVLDPVELDPRADVYALAGTIYNVITGRTFFDDVTNPRDRIIAHMQREPLEDPARLEGQPAALAKLLRAATAKDPRDRPFPMELSREFSLLV